MIGPPTSPSQGSPPLASPLASSPTSAADPRSIPDSRILYQTGRDTRTGRAPLVLLALLASLPALALLPGLFESRHLFTLYREPKLLAAQLLLWPLLAVFAWRRRPLWRPRAISTTLARPPLAIWCVFLSWSILTVLWTLVRPNAFYDLLQLLPLTALLVALVAWGDSEPRMARAAVAGLVASLGVATAIGGLQLAVSIPWLPPIDPQYGVSNPSVMGYKNPMALALLGQIFLLAWACAGPRRGRLGRWGLRCLLAIELGYLATLQSRTATTAVLVGGLLLAVLAWARKRLQARRGEETTPPPTRSGRLSPLGWALTAVVLFLGVGLLHPGARDRLASAGSYLAEPGSFLTSDRGAYLRNTLHMASSRPLGVGLGDWQTHYPVYRRHDRFRSFNDRFQVRRAHSDHVQVLGETGWPGLLLWLAFLAAVIGSAVRRYLTSGDRLALFAGVQVAALTVAMATDYVIDMPYHRLQLFLVVALALVHAPRADSSPPETAVRRPGWRPGWRLPAAAVVTAAGITACTWAASSLAREWQAARLESRWATLIDPATGETRVESPAEPLVRAALVRLQSDAAGFLAFPGHTKTQYRDHLLLAHLALLLEDRPLAESQAHRALELHPHHPNTLRLLAAIAGEDAKRAIGYRRGYHYLMSRAETGLPLPFPPSPARSASAQDDAD